MKFKLEITMDNDAFADEPASELACSLESIAMDIRESGAGAFDRVPILDGNGNTIGSYYTVND